MCVIPKLSLNDLVMVFTTLLVEVLMVIIFDLASWPVSLLSLVNWSVVHVQDFVLNFQKPRAVPETLEKDSSVEQTI